VSDATPTTDAGTTDPASLGYADALAELEVILRDLEDGDVDIDHLAEQVRRAAVLVEHCRGRLADARTAVTRIVADLDTAGPVIAPTLDGDSGAGGDDLTDPLIDRS
jgi:exodeoxyribonuclease VII small subunit